MSQRITVTYSQKEGTGLKEKTMTPTSIDWWRYIYLCLSRELKVYSMYFVWFLPWLTFSIYLVRDPSVCLSHSVMSDSCYAILWTVACQVHSVTRDSPKQKYWVGCVPFSREIILSKGDFLCIYLKGIWWELNEKENLGVLRTWKPSQSIWTVRPKDGHNRRLKWWDLVDAEEIRRDGKNTQKNFVKDLIVRFYYDGVVSHQSPSILECKVKWA